MYVDPLVLDLDGNGVELTQYDVTPVLFDIDHDGSEEQTGWVSPTDGLLVVDLNSDGVINDVGEIISEYFNGAIGVGGSPGETPFQDGFDALASLDSNTDNIFDNNDVLIFAMFFTNNFINTFI